MFTSMRMVHTSTRVGGKASKPLVWLLNSAADAVSSTASGVNTVVSSAGSAVAGTIESSAKAAKDVLPQEPLVPLPKAATSSLSAAASLVRVGTSLTKSALGAAAQLGGAAGSVVGSVVVDAVSGRNGKGSQASALGDAMDPELVRAATRLASTTSSAVMSVLDTAEAASATVVDSSLGSVSSLVGQTLGPEAGDVVRANLTVVNDAVKTMYKVKSFGIRKMASSSAKSFRDQALRSVLVLSPEVVAAAQPSSSSHVPIPLTDSEDLVVIPLMTASNYTHSRPVRFPQAHQLKQL
ncbi:uncharacterized protein AMSG_07505 [Thecamonas trahens ATCC 50062]|uniref:Senescence domain-containing protein n=1 Tax=Thecamonas trahens ATCC 50062 TaxID=461836 RepID=A0A0L0DH12_THETB|nr:hypothetical protein AMSG_07505 [Thecamonas trahens ATCC 50062]KNC51597.1 hypothetical protein AMSG_07505 [Thecamonas trahens ATCC 50062]|eukprot:XP_013755995.1 hypothetical protein AMSG_07505 [Thecamonas trahens ATCC 50062]